MSRLPGFGVSLSLSVMAIHGNLLALILQPYHPSVDVAFFCIPRR
ncbi:hypothetical protein [Kallotenue papyrolyticum]|nr:hypothetical protein [Kallotenue papyrolyticum]